jgi:CheY-like chemotaxis protein
MTKLVLFVDDDLDVREAWADLLAFRGWEVAHASDGLEALQWLGAHRAPDAILLDLKMPRCDGYQFRAAQLADPRWRNIPTVVFTADAKVEGSRLPSLGGARVAYKTVDFAQLAALLDEVARKG